MGGATSWHHHGPLVHDLAHDDLAHDLRACAAGWAAGRRPLCRSRRPGSSRPVKASITTPLARAGAGAAARRRRDAGRGPPSRRRTRVRVAIRSSGHEAQDEDLEGQRPREAAQDEPLHAGGGQVGGPPQQEDAGSQAGGDDLGKEVVEHRHEGERGRSQRHEDCPHPVDRHQGPELDRAAVPWARCASTRSTPRATARCSPSSSSRPGRPRARRTCTSRWPPCVRWRPTSSASPTAPAARRAARRSRSSRASATRSAWRRWRTSPAWGRPSTSCAPRSTR